MELITKIVVAVIILIMWSTCAYLGWRVLKLRKRVELLQDDRNKLLEDSDREKIYLSGQERKMILAGLGTSEFKDTIENPATTYQVRKVYKELVEKVGG
jgi:hypothetical protein